MDLARVVLYEKRAKIKYQDVGEKKREKRGGGGEGISKFMLCSFFEKIFFINFLAINLPWVSKSFFYKIPFFLLGGLGGGGFGFFVLAMKKKKKKKTKKLKKRRTLRKNQSAVFFHYRKF